MAYTNPPGKSAVAAHIRDRKCDRIRHGSVLSVSGAANLSDEPVLPPNGSRSPQTVFSDPDRFDVTRDAASHLSFGAGVHHCLGAQLARVELQEAFRGLIGRLPGLRLAVPASELEFKPGMAIHSLRELPVFWDQP